MAINLKHQTADQFAHRFRERFRDVLGQDCARLSTWLLDSFDRGDFQELPFRTAFGHSVAQWNSFKARLNSNRTSWRNVKASNGE